MDKYYDTYRLHSKHSEQQTTACRKYAGNINVIIGAYERDVDQGSCSGSLEFIKIKVNSEWGSL